MEDLSKCRKQIDDLDKSIMELLEKRMHLSRKIGKIKKLNQITTEDISREVEILNFADRYNNAHQIKEIYKQIFINSKELQKYKYFLVGKSLEYSYSPKIYSMLGLHDYNLFTTDNFSIVKKMDFLGINITNPYKKEAFKICDELDESASKTEAVNTIIRKDDKLIGYNTDYFGFSSLLEYNKVQLENKKIIIIGNGATANTITNVLMEKKALKIIYLVRSVRRENEYDLSEYQRFNDFEIIINTTPYGTYPNNQMHPLFNLDGFENLEVLIDVIYNPKYSPLLLYKKDNIKKINGLYMLVAQAAKAASLYANKDKTSLIKEVYMKLNFNLSNIVLIGMPYSGKTELAKKLAQEINHKLIDLDSVMLANNQDLASILKNGTISDFRKYEEVNAIKYAKENQLIISTGGGIVLSKTAMNALSQNGVIVFLDTPLTELINRIDETRPLIKSKEDLVRLYNGRIDLYNKYADIIVNKDDNVDIILEKIYEYINN